MSSSSDSDEYYDAEDITPSKLPSCKKPKTVSLTPSKSESDFQSTLRDEKRQDVGASPRVPSSLGLQFASELASFEKYQSKRHKLRELRRKMQMEDEEVGGAIGTSPTSSQTSSFDGVFPGPDTKSSHPFRIIEHDALSLHSLTSLSRSGRIQSASQEQASQTVNTGTQFSPTDAAANSTFTGSTTTLRHFEGNEAPTNPPNNEPGAKHDAPKLQEPDVIASTKAGGTSSVTSVNSPPIDSCHQQSPAPIAPPRKRKQAKTAAQPPPNTLPIKQHDQPKVSKSNADELSGRRATLPSPASTIESITREFEHSLDISAATKGQCIVKPQDNSENKSKCFRSGRNSSTYPLGSGVPGGSGPIPGGKRERRKSAGDEQTISNQLNMFVRTQTDSGKPLSDLCINPLSLHIMRLTSEYVSNTSLEKGRRESDEDSLDSKLSRVTGIDGESEAGMVKRRTAQVKKFFGTAVKKTMSKAKTIGRHNKEDPKEEVIDEPSTSTGEQYIKIKASSSHKGPYEFEFVQNVQDLSGHHMGPVWCMKFSVCGRLLATAGQDRVLRIWVVRSAYDYFQDIRTKYQVEKVSPTPSQESIVSQISSDDTIFHLDELSAKAPFMPKPFCTYTGHTSDLLDVSWSKNYFILSSSMDKTVRLWHISRKECLCCFQHIDFVTAIVFHPRDDRYFLSGSLDGKLRLWNIPDKKVAVWKEVDGPAKLITAANFCENGKFAVVGSYDGRCIFYTTDQLKYHTTIHVRSTRGKNATGRKISGIEPMPGEEKILITSNDSRIRLYDLRELSVSCKYKGYANLSSQIKASFSHDGKFIVSGSENQCIYIWKSNHDYSTFSSVRRDRNDYWEGIKIHNAVVTCAVFSPNPDIVMRKIDELEGNTTGVQTTSGYVLVSADFNGSIKVLLNKTKPKHSSLPASALA